MRSFVAGAFGLCALSVAAGFFAPLGAARGAATPGAPAAADRSFPPPMTGPLDVHAIEGAASVTLYWASGEFRGGSVNPKMLPGVGCKYGTRDRAAIAALIEILMSSVKTADPYPGGDARIGVIFEDAQGKQLGALYSPDRVAESVILGQFVAADGAETRFLATKGYPDRLREWRKRSDVVFEGYPSFPDGPMSARAQAVCQNV
ncbi:MAG: hypothetical protein JWM33_2851 [Caulobacteraceae bacterium]|nr:hypothetical protein [Caulobacteraceae bacterium]